MQNDKAGAQYWNQMWADANLPPRVDPRRAGPSNLVYRVFDRYMRRTFAERGIGEGSRLLEVGAGNSAWLPYLAIEYGVGVTGLDYSETGCRKLRRILARDGVEGDVVEADLFAPPANLLGAFDAVLSFGVAEHFQDTRGTIAAFARFVRPGGIVMTFVPNMSGILGESQRLLNKPVYDIHMPLDARALREANEEAGLIVDACDYLVFLNFGILNLNGMVRGTPEFVAKRALLAFARRAGFVAAALEERTHRLPLTRATASYVVAVARAPA